MRQDTRKRPIFRPSNLILEARNAASDLASGLSLLGTTKVATTLLASSERAALEFPSGALAASGRAPVLASVQPSTVSHAADRRTVARQTPTAPPTPLPVGPLSNDLTIPTIAQPPASGGPLVSPQSSAATPRRGAGGGAQTRSHGAPVAAPTAGGGAVGPTSTPATPPPAPIATAAPTPIVVAPDSTGIRPMSLAPSNTGAGPGVSPMSIDPMPQGTPPVINVSGGQYTPPTGSGGGSYGISGTGTNNTIQAVVPIGTYFNCAVTPPVNSGLTISSVTWDGLGTVGDYIPTGSTGTTAPPASLTSIPAPITNKETTNFLVVTPGTTSTVKATVTYAGIAGMWVSSVTFTSGQVPTYTYLGSTMGEAAPAPAIPDNKSVLWFVNNVRVGMSIEAQTNTAFPGQYMFMQLISPLRQYSDGTNTYQLTNAAQGLQAFDNGAFGGPSNTLGTSISNKAGGGILANNQWTQDNATAQDLITDDSAPQNIPSANGQPPAPTVPTSVSVGGLNGAGGNETYTTYLMYEPPAGVRGEWVAIGQVTWGWGGTGIVNGGFFDPQVVNPSITPVMPQALKATTPLWNTTSTAIIAAGWKKA